MDAKNEADSLVFQVEDALKDAGDKLDPADKAKLESDTQALKDILARHTDPSEILSEADTNEINAARDRLVEDAQQLFAMKYEQAQGAPEGADFGGQAQGGGDDDVVDADYTEV